MNDFFGWGGGQLLKNKDEAKKWQRKENKKK
jgi:hypothetical protein